MTGMIEELDHRENHGIAVSLLWDRRSNTLAVRVCDRAKDEEFEIACAHDDALDVFHHPYAYAATRPVTHCCPTAVA